MAKTVYQILIELQGSAQARAELGQLSESARSLGTVLGLTGASLTAFGALADQAAANYELALAKLGTVTKATAEEQAIYEQGLQDVVDAVSNATSKTALLEPAYKAASAGIRDTALNLSLLEGNVKLAVGGFATQEETLQATISAYKQYNTALGDSLTESEKVRLVQEQLILVQNQGDTTLGQVASQYSRVIPIARAAGISLEELNAAIASGTGEGIPAEQTITGLRETIAGIVRGGATEEARATIAELGLSFNAAGLESKGLTEVLKELSAQGLTSADDLIALFGSQEAVALVSTLLKDDVGRLSKELELFQSRLTTLDDTFDRIAETRAERLNQALNKVQDSLIGLGQGVLEASVPLLEALSSALDLFNELPTALKDVIGLGVVVGGLLLTAAGGLLFLAGTLGSLVTAASSLTPLLGALSAGFTVGTGSASAFSAALLTSSAAAGTLSPQLALMSTGLTKTGTAATGATIGVRAFGASLAPLATAVAGVTIAITALTAAYLLYELQEARLRNEDNKRSLDFANQAALMDKVTRAINRLRESGEALPQAEFELLISTLEDANDDVGGLDSAIASLTQAQALAGAGLLEQDTILNGIQSTLLGAAGATDTFTGSQEQLAEQLVTNSTKALEELEQGFADLQQSLSNRVASGDLSETESLQEQLATQRTVTRETVKLNRELANSSFLSSGERVAARKRVTQALEQGAAEEARIQRELRALERENLNQIAEQQIAQQNRARSQRQQSEELTRAAIATIQEEQLTQTLGFLEQEIRAVGQNTNERTRLLTQYYQTEAQLSQASLERRQAELGEFQRNIEIVRSEIQRATSLSTMSINNQTLMNQSSSGLLGGLGGLFTDLESVEQRAQEARESVADALGNFRASGSVAGSQEAVALRETRELQRSITSELRTQESIALELAQSFREQGLITGQLETADQARAAIAQAMLTLKVQELEIQRQQITNTLRVQALEQQILIQEQEALVASGTQTGQENALSQARIQAARTTIGLLEEQARIQQTNVDLELQLLRAREQTNAVRDGRSPRAAAQQFDSARSQVAGAQGDVSMGLQNLGTTLKTGSDQTLDALGQLRELSQEQGSQALSSLESIPGALVPAAQQQTTLLARVPEGLGVLNGAVNSQTQALGTRLEALGSKLDALPGRIAAQIPRSGDR